MKKYRVIFTAEALIQLEGLQFHIQDKAGSGIASSYISRIRAYCESFSTFPQRGTKRDDLIPGLRIANYKKRTIITLVIEDKDVIITGIFYGGRDVDSWLTDMDM